MDILMVVYNDLENDARVLRSAEALGKKHNVKVISLGSHEIKNEYFTSINIKKKKIPSVIEYLWFVVRTLLISRKLKYDVVYGHDYYSALLLYVLKKFKKGKYYIYDAHELMIPSEHKELSFREKIYLFFEKKAVNKVNLVITAQEKRAKIMEKYYKLDKKPTVIKNISILPQEESYNFSKKLSNFFNKYEKIIVYAGAVTDSRELKKILDAIDQYSDNYGLIIIGRGNYLQTLKNYAENEEMSNIYFTGNIPYNQLASILKKCDIGYLYYSNVGLNNKHCAPNKIYEYASVNLPMISNENYTVSKIFKESGIGISNNNIKQSIQEINSKYDMYLKNILKFKEEEKWENEEERLVVAVQELYKSEGV